MQSPIYHCATLETAFGSARIAVGDRGVAALVLGDSAAALDRNLRAVLPERAVIEEDATAAGMLEAIERAILEKRATDVPLDLRGSALELAVWQALREIPAGETTTYGAIARRLPLPATAQKVGAACAANRIAVAVPCHRVVKADGSISGYRWGVWRKRRLLAAEAA